MSNSLVKLIDASLIPAILIIFGKFVGIYFFIFLFNIEPEIISSTSTLFSFKTALFEEELLLVSTYSDLFMFTLISIGFIVVLFRSTFLQTDKISINTISKLAEYNLLQLVKGSYDLYHTAVIWFVFTWIANVIILIDVLVGKTYFWVVILTTIFSIALSVALFRDIVKEIELSKQEIFNNN